MTLWRRRPDSSRNRAPASERGYPHPPKMLPVMWRGEWVAAASATGYTLCERLLARHVEDPERTFAALMALYAQLSLAGEFTEPYTDDLARAWARHRMIPAEFLERPCVDPASTAAWLGVPETELIA